MFCLGAGKDDGSDAPPPWDEQAHAPAGCRVAAGRDGWLVVKATLLALRRRERRR